MHPTHTYLFLHFSLTSRLFCMHPSRDCLSAPLHSPHHCQPASVLHLSLSAPLIAASLSASPLCLPSPSLHLSFHQSHLSVRTFPCPYYSQCAPSLHFYLPKLPACIFFCTYFSMPASLSAPLLVCSSPCSLLSSLCFSLAALFILPSRLSDLFLLHPLDSTSP